jgi:hypothetical protein
MGYTSNVLEHYAEVRCRLSSPPAPKPVAPPPEPSRAQPIVLPQPQPDLIERPPQVFARELLAALGALEGREIADVIKIAARLMNLDAAQFCQQDKSRELSLPRQIAMAVCMLG